MIPTVCVAVVMMVVGARENRSEIVVVIVGDVATVPPNHVLVVEWHLARGGPLLWYNM